MKNWLIEYSRYAFTKAKQGIAVTFSIVGFVGTFIGLMGSFNLLDTKGIKELSIMQCIYFFCGILIALFIIALLLAYINVGVVSALLRANPDNERYRRLMAEIDEMRFRGLYVDKQIHEIQNAKKTILLSIHSLSDENEKEQYKRFNEALFEAQERGVKVKVLAPCGRERARGAYQLSEHHHIEIKFANQLEIEDLRFILVDDERIVLSQQEIPNKGLSAKFSEIRGKEVCKMLKAYYKEVWENACTLDYNHFLIKCTRDLFRSESDIDLTVAAKNLKVPKKALEKAFLCGENCMLDNQPK